MLEEFIDSGYELNGEKYYSFMQIGTYLFPEMQDIWAASKIRYIYKYRKAILEPYSTKTKSELFNQTIVVLNWEGVKELCRCIRRTDRNERVESILCN